MAYDYKYTECDYCGYRNFGCGLPPGSRCLQCKKGVMCARGRE